MLLGDNFAIDTQLVGEDIRHVVAGHVQCRGDDVIRLHAGKLDDVLAQIGFHGLQIMVLQTLVQVQFLGGHRLGLHNQLRAALFGQVQDEVRHLGPVVAKHYLSAMRGDVLLYLLQVVIQIVDSVFLQQIRVCAQILIIGQKVAGNRVLAVIDQPAGPGIDRKLQVGVG